MIGAPGVHPHLSGRAWFRVYGLGPFLAMLPPLCCDINLVTRRSVASQGLVTRLMMKFRRASSVVRQGV